MPAETPECFFPTSLVLFPSITFLQIFSQLFVIRVICGILFCFFVPCVRLQMVRVRRRKNLKRSTTAYQARCLRVKKERVPSFRKRFPSVPRTTAHRLRNLGNTLSKVEREQIIVPAVTETINKLLLIPFPKPNSRQKRREIVGFAECRRYMEAHWQTLTKKRLGSAFIPERDKFNDICKANGWNSKIQKCRQNNGL